MSDALRVKLGKTQVESKQKKIHPPITDSRAWLAARTAKKYPPVPRIPVVIGSQAIPTSDDLQDLAGLPWRPQTFTTTRTCVDESEDDQNKFGYEEIQICFIDSEQKQRLEEVANLQEPNGKGIWFEGKKRDCITVLSLKDKAHEAVHHNSPYDQIKQHAH